MAAEDGTIRIGMLGAGLRSTSFVGPIAALGPQASLVAVMDSNPERMKAACRLQGYPEDIRQFDDLDGFLESRCVDLIMVNTPDFTHHELIPKCLGAGYHVFAEKPLAITPEGIVEIIKARDAADKMLLMGFNLRFHNKMRQMKRIQQRGEIGDVRTAWCYHAESGIRYFRRWHKFREKSGGLLVHKGCHSLDILNWLIESCPVEVHAQGGIFVFKGKKGGQDCHACPERDGCPWARRMNKEQQEILDEVYVGPAGKGDDTHDHCPFGDDATGTDLGMALIKYANGAMASYTECHFAGQPGCDYGFVGTRGEIRSSDIYEDRVRRMDRLTGEKAVFDTPRIMGWHGGADGAMVREMVRAVQTGRQLLPSAEEGARSCIIGIAAYKSMELGRPVRIDELLPLELLEKTLTEPMIRDDNLADGRAY